MQLHANHLQARHYLPQQQPQYSVLLRAVTGTAEVLILIAYSLGFESLSILLQALNCAGTSAGRGVEMQYTLQFARGSQPVAHQRQSHTKEERDDRTGPVACRIPERQPAVGTSVLPAVMVARAPNALSTAWTDALA